MNIQEYISSGIIQSYALGLADPEERAEFERRCLEYPELIAARKAFEELLEKQALDQAIEPPPGLKTGILAAIAHEPAGFSGKTGSEKALDPAPIRVFQPGWFRYAAAAAVLLLVASAALNFYFFARYRETMAKYDRLVLAQTQLASSNQTLQTRLQDDDSALNLIKNPLIAEIKMPGLAGGPDPSGLTTVYWDTRSKDVYLLVNQLPRQTPDKQYQLWAIVDGLPVDAGVFDLNQGLSFMKMKNIPRAQAFAITLEKRGGSKTPNMEALYVLGKVTG